MTARATCHGLCHCDVERAAGNDDVRADVVDRPLDPVSIAELAKLLGVEIASTDWAALVDRLAKDAGPRRAALFVILSGGALC